MNWNELSAAVGYIAMGLFSGAGIVFALSAWLGNIWAKRIMNNEMAKHNKDLEECKASYQQLLDENNIRFSFWHNEQANAFQKQYALLAEMGRRLKCMTNPAKFIPVDVDTGKYLTDEFNDFMASYKLCYQFYMENKILLSDRHIALMENIFNNVQIALCKYKSSISRLNTKQTKEMYEECEEASKAALDIDKILDDIRKDFRDILQGKIN